jgi:hypothetical protein
MPFDGIDYKVLSQAAYAHSLNETFDTKDSRIGTQRALLLAVALAR